MRKESMELNQSICYSPCMNVPRRVMDKAQAIVKAHMSRQDDMRSVFLHEKLEEAEDSFQSDPAVWFLGSGCSRQAWSVSLPSDELLVFKFETEGVPGCNEKEKAVWERVKGTEFEQHFARVHDVQGILMIQEFIHVNRKPSLDGIFYRESEILAEKLAKVGIIVQDDRNEKNATILPNRGVVYFDYGHFKIH